MDEGERECACEREHEMTDEPIDGQVLLLAAAKASVPSARLPDLVERAQAELERRLDRYSREYECVYLDRDANCTDAPVDDAGVVYGFLAERGHWEALGADLGFDRREADAVRRAHEEHLLRIGRRDDRADEFEAALEIREPVFVGAGADRRE